MVLIAGIWTTLFVFRIDSYTGNVELTRWANAYIKNWWVLIVIAAWLLFMYKDKIRQAIRRRFPDQRQ